jgi:membrane protease YdiL (CAAX protease family)
MHYASLIIEVLLVGYILRDAARALPLYRQLKQGIASGDTGARSRMYREILAFEWISAALALGALGFDWSKLTPRSLALADSLWIPRLASQPYFVRGIGSGVLIGILIGGLGFIVLRKLRNRRGAGPAPAARASRLSQWLPDFSALVPVTARERLIFVAVAVSAGICEEIVFRGWVLSALHEQLGLQGASLIWVAAVIFGLAHIYQGITGVLVTGMVGTVFCLLYIATGSLLLPIVLHVLLDVRLAFLPAPRVPKPAPA